MTFLPSSVTNIKVAKTDTSFMKIWHNYLYNNSFYPNSNI